MSSKKITVVRLAHVHYQHPHLQKASTFLDDFGFVEALKTDSRIYYHGYGVQPYVYIAEQSPDSKRHFLGGAWVVESERDLEIAASHPEATGIRDNTAPGGGKIVSLTDPNGFLVSFVWGQALREENQPNGNQVIFHEESAGVAANTTLERPRKGQFRRFRQGPSHVSRLGHYGFIVPKSRYRKTLDWYLGIMNLKPTDAVFDPATGEDETCFNHIDAGEQFTDHHSFFVGTCAEDIPPHVHHSSFEVNDFDTQSLGHDWLVAKGWTNCWGIGRHVLGSQIFDYWFDGSGNILEHYSDGDLVNSDTPVGREPAATNTLYIWGPNIPLGFVTGSVDDAGKGLTVRVEATKEPDPIEAKEAVIATSILVDT